MKSIRKFTMVLLMAVLALSVFTACSGGGTMVSNTTDTSVAVKLGASSSIRDNEYLDKLAQLNFHSAELVAEALGGKDVTSADEQCQKDIKSVKSALQSQGIVVDDVICGTGATREEAIADLVANYPNAGKGKKYCGMAEGEISFSILGIGDKSYYIYIVFGTDASGSTSATNVTISLSASPSGCGTVYGSGTYTKGKSVTVKATPSKGYSFAGWKKNGAIVSTSASYTFTASESISLTAVFEKNTITVSLSVSPSGSGTVTGADTYTKGDSVTVTATPNTGYRFVSWQEDGLAVSTDTSYTFTASESVTLDAIFEVDLAAIQQEVLRLVNIEREEAGVDPLTMDDDNLLEAAQLRATELVTLYSHTRPDGTSCFTVLSEYGVTSVCRGENIAKGQGSPSAVMNAWMNSQGHRENILNSNYKKIGIGYYYSNGCRYWVQVFIG